MMGNNTIRFKFTVILGNKGFFIELKPTFANLKEIYNV